MQQNSPLRSPYPPSEFLLHTIMPQPCDSEHPTSAPSLFKAIGFIGAGRLAKTLAWHVHACGLPVAAVASRSQASAETLAARIPGCLVLDTPQAVANCCSLVFITTPDALITPTANVIRWRPGMQVVHCSGATEVSALASAAQAGAMTGGFHPLQTFADPDAALRTLPGCMITIEAPAPFEDQLAALATRLGCRVNRLPPGARPLYHAAAGYASQFINALLGDAVRMWQSWGATEADALHALLPLVRGTLASIANSGLPAGMPGPVSRGDVASVTGHVAAVQAFDPKAMPLYTELCLRTVELARQAQRIDDATVKQFTAVLTRTSQP